jgi:hypothetical protein
MERIRQLWKDTFGTRNRKPSPTAMEIAARRYGLKNKTLEFQKEPAQSGRKENTCAGLTSYSHFRTDMP